MTGSVFVTNDRQAPTTVTVSPWGEMRAQLDASPVFYEDFSSGTLDTTIKWLTQAIGTGVLPSNAVGTSVLNGGTTANSVSLLQTRTSFQPQEPGWVQYVGRINLQNPVPNANYLAWGIFSTPGTPTFAAPISNGALFEIGATGKLSAVTYASGVRLLIKDLSGLTPQDTSAHKYYIWFRGDLTYWAIDDIDNVVASFITGASGPDVNTLPASFIVVSNGGSAATMQVNAAVIGNTTGGNITQSDPVYPWRQQSVVPSGAATFSSQVNSEGDRATYRYSVLGFTPVATPTAFVVIQGSATRILRVKNIRLGGVATASGNMPVIVNRRSTAGTLGSAVLTAVTAFKHDTTDANATGVVSTVGTANYTTLGTAVGGVGIADRIDLAAVGTGISAPNVRDFSTRQDKPIVLRGVSDFLTIEGSGAAVPAGGLLDIEIEIEESQY